MYTHDDNGIELCFRFSIVLLWSDSNFLASIIRKCFVSDETDMSRIIAKKYKKSIVVSIVNIERKHIEAGTLRSSNSFAVVIGRQRLLDRNFLFKKCSSN